MPEFAFLALCRLARPLARPGPRCSSVEAGAPFMRKYPSAAPVTTPSNRPSTQRMPGTRSSAATKCISEVPGLVKQTSTPPLTIVRTRLSAPFIPRLPQPAISHDPFRSIIVRDARQSNSGHCGPAPRDDATVWLMLFGKLAWLPIWQRQLLGDDGSHGAVACEMRANMDTGLF